MAKSLRLTFVLIITGSLFISSWSAHVVAGVKPSRAANTTSLESLPHTVWRIKLRKKRRLGRGLYQYSTPVFEYGHIYTGSATGEVIATNPQGKIQWRTPTDNPVYAPVSVTLNKVYAVDSEGTLYALHRSTGKEDWRVSLSSEVMSRPLIVESQLILVDMNATGNEP